MSIDLFRVVQPVGDMARADAFYAELLQLEVDAVVSTRHYLHTSSSILALVDPREHGRSFAPMPEWLYLRVPDLDAAWKRAQALGCPVPENEAEGIAKRPWGERSFYTRDPFANPLCLIDDMGSEMTDPTRVYQGHPRAAVYKAILPTRDQAASDAFFERVLDMRVDPEVPTRHFFYCESAVLALIDSVGHRRAHREAPEPFRANPELVYFAVPDLDACFERAQQAGLTALEDDDVGWGIAERPWGERSFYGRDPSGNPICFVGRGTCFVGVGRPRG